MVQPSDSREVSSASDVEETSKAPSLQGDGSSSPTDDDGWPAFISRSRCRRPKWTKEEEMILVEAHCTLGNAWVAIAECLPGRTPSEVKNIWHSTLRARKLQTRSVLRAYVTALKDRADKPAARQQAMRIAQHFLNEASGGKSSSPTKRGRPDAAFPALLRDDAQVPKRSPIQQQQQKELQHQQQEHQHHQQQQQQERAWLPQPQTTSTMSGGPPYPQLPPSAAMIPATATSSHHRSCQDMAVSALGASAYGTAEGGGRDTVLMGPAATLATRPPAVVANGVIVAPPSTSAPPPAAAGHRSSLGSDWSSMSSGAVESWHLHSGTGASSSATIVAAGTRHAPTMQQVIPSGGGPTDFMAVLTPPHIMSYSPLVSPASSAYTMPPATVVDRRASTGAVITTTHAAADSRRNSPVFHAESPAPVGCGGGLHSDWREGLESAAAGYGHDCGGAMVLNTRVGNFGGRSANVANLLELNSNANVSASATSKLQVEDRCQALWTQSPVSVSRDGFACATVAASAAAASAATAYGGMGTFTRGVMTGSLAEMRGPYVVSTGLANATGSSGNGSDGGGCYWVGEGQVTGSGRSGGSQAAARFPTPPSNSQPTSMLFSAAPGGHITVQDPSVVPPSVAAPFINSLCVSNNNCDGYPSRDTSNTCAGIDRGSGSGSGRTGGGVVTLGLYGITDEDLLACIGA